MWISVIASLVCFAVATILFTPSLRDYPFYRSLALYFIFQGLWTIFSWAFFAIFENEYFMMQVQYLGSILFAGYLAYNLHKYASSKKNTANPDDVSKDKDN